MKCPNCGDFPMTLMDVVDEGILDDKKIEMECLYYCEHCKKEFFVTELFVFKETTSVREVDFD